MQNKGAFFTLRKHRKKSIFAAGLLCYGFHYASQRYRENLIRREYFIEAKTYGEQIISPLVKPKRLYVILNPTASNGKCKALFQKNAAPILNLAGIDLTFIQTDYEGHAKTTVNYFDPNIDGIVVAGGDGVLQEVVTGMFRQRDEENIATMPVGFIPLGTNSNFMYSKLFSSDTFHTRSICKATMAVVKGHLKESSVMEIKSEQKPVYALSTIHFGVHQEVKQKINAGKYWLLGPFKKQFAFIWRTVRNWPPSFSIRLSCANVADTNVSNIQEKKDTSIGMPQEHALDSNITGTVVSDTSTCSKQSEEMETDNFSIYLRENGGANDEPVLLLQKTTNDQPRIEFIKRGWAWMKNKFNYTANDKSETMTCNEISINPPDEEISYDIDGEIFDARPITVRIDPRKLKLFCNPGS